MFISFWYFSGFFFSLALFCFDIIRGAKLLIHLGRTIKARRLASRSFRYRLILGPSTYKANLAQSGVTAATFLLKIPYHVRYHFNLEYHLDSQ